MAAMLAEVTMRLRLTAAVSGWAVGAARGPNRLEWCLCHMWCVGGGRHCEKKRIAITTMRWLLGP
jgi:hypothetical protein